jgi:hypothetical protein
MKRHAFVLLAALALQGVVFATPQTSPASQVTITLVRWPFT